MIRLHCGSSSLEELLRSMPSLQPLVAAWVRHVSTTRGSYNRQWNFAGFNHAPFLHHELCVQQSQELWHAFLQKLFRKTTSRLSQKYSEILKNITHPLVTRAQFAKLLLLDWGAQGWAFAQGNRQPHHAIERRPKLLGNLAGCSNGQTEFRAWHHMEPLPRGNHGKWTSMNIKCTSFWVWTCLNEIERFDFHPLKFQSGASVTPPRHDSLSVYIYIFFCLRLCLGTSVKQSISFDQLYWFVKWIVHPGSQGG